MKIKRELTCVQFGERSPTVAVGDNRGTVMVYRIISPMTITHEGPLQQTLKLKNAVAKQVIYVGRFLRLRLQSYVR